MDTEIPTLLQLANVPPFLLNTANAALLLIDFQKEYVSGKLQLGAMGDQAIAGAKTLLDFARQKQMRIFHIQHISKPDSAVFASNSENITIIDQLKPVNGEFVIQKTLPNAFDRTDLNDLLLQNNITQLLVAGFMSHMCVSTTVRAALPLGYDVIICEDACATRSLTYEEKVIPASTLHIATMAALQDRFASLISSRHLKVLNKAYGLN